nr:hypothetical protein GCM10025699_16580 [Microbacterium flavescens]
MGDMCGRFALNAKTDEIIREFVADGGDFRDWTPRYSIAPTQIVPIVRERADPAKGSSAGSSTRRCGTSTRRS